MAIQNTPGLANLVTACWRCNSSKADFTLDELGWTLPPSEERVRSDWQGLTDRYLAMWDEAGRPDAAYHRQWFSALDVYLHRRDSGPAAAWWTAVAEYPRGAPGIVRELLSSRSVVCDPLEAQQALAWAKAHPAWVDDPAPLVVENPYR